MAREYKKFAYSVARPGAQGRDYVGSLQWIEDAGIIRRCYNTEITELPLECKATTGNAKSMRTVLKNHDKYHVDSALKVGDYNIGRKDNLLTMPMYLALLLTEV